MADVLETASDWLTTMNRAHRPRTVTYVRGESTASVVAVVGRTMHRVPRDFGLYEEVETRDYLIQVDNLAAFGEPAPGDRIKDTLNAAVEIFEVMSPGDEPVFRYSDAYRKLFRVHTKHVGAGT